MRRKKRKRYRESFLNTLVSDGTGARHSVCGELVSLNGSAGVGIAPLRAQFYRSARA